MHARIHSFGLRRLAVVVLAAGLAGVVAVPTILAAPAPATSEALDGSLALSNQPGSLGRLMRGDVTVLKGDGSTMTVHFERGRISAASATSVTLSGADGTSVTFALASSTRIRVDRKAASADALKVGEFALALGTPAGAGYDALLVRVPTRQPAN
jgi:hypothetical protein